MPSLRVLPRRRMCLYCRRPAAALYMVVRCVVIDSSVQAASWFAGNVFLFWEVRVDAWRTVYCSVVSV